jgi:hypothetical protein
VAAGQQFRLGMLCQKPLCAGDRVGSKVIERGCIHGSASLCTML